MTTDLKALIAAALAEDGPVAALTVLRGAADWSAEALAAGLADDVAAFQAVVALDDALDRLAAVERAVPALVEAASPGRPVQDHLRERHAELAAARDRLATDRAALDDLGRAERELAEVAAEHDRLRGRVAELRRLRRLADEVEDLRAQEEALTAQAAALTAPAEDAERAAGQAAGELLRLTREQLAVLDPQVRQAIEDAAAAHAELSDLRERLDGAEERIEASRAELAEAAQGFDRLRDRHEQILGPLRAYRRADRDLAAALNGGALSLTKDSGLERAERELATIEERLAAIDEVLARVLTDHAQAHEKARTTLGWAG
ncbi:hypothetical protein [Actinomadura rubrisoli]|uniref:Chromosome partition protein Smc n=1 Tax=Actinomadura rubrisoli TaxID=2530368 RepID=A0A4R5BUS2_9ACTN|nr:hypothetical protein [Actinomadura rubrisoli]TDD89839.1 hypothetical protein E1298_13675 [Actinomadura rubrisoli]